MSVPVVSIKHLKMCIGTEKQCIHDIICIVPNMRSEIGAQAAGAGTHRTHLETATFASTKVPSPEKKRGGNLKASNWCQYVHRSN